MDKIGIKKMGILPSDNEIIKTQYNYTKTLPSGMLKIISGGEINIKTPCETSFSPTPYLLLLYCIEGTVNIIADGKPKVLAAGHFIICDMSNVFQIKTVLLPLNLRYCFVAGDYSVFKEPLRNPEPIHPALHFPSPLNLDKLMNISENIAFDQALDLHLLFTQILTIYCKSMISTKEDAPENSENIPGYLVAMHHTIINHFEEPHTLQHFEDRYGISRYQLCREYHLAFGISPMKDLNKIRINNAKRMLINSSLSVQEISTRVGFFDVNNFIKIFKKHSGCTPGNFRKINFH